MEKIVDLLFSFAGIFSLTIVVLPYLLRYRLSVPSLATLAVSLGVLGTFIGIFVGLLGFEVEHISQSVPQLLEGLKTAFLTSIAGLVSSIVLKNFPHWYGIKVEKTNTKEGASDLKLMILLLKDLRLNMEKMNKHTGGGFGVERDENMISLLMGLGKLMYKLEKSIAGEGETTLVTQIQKLRMSNADRLDDMNQSFREFSEKMVLNSTQSLIDAPTQVMKGFNEQFGENFERLNDAVGKMLEWQKEYAAGVGQMTEQFQRMLDATYVSESSRAPETQKEV